MSSEETVHLAITTSGGYGEIYHSDPECVCIDNARSVAEKSLEVLDGSYRECKLCQGASSGGGCDDPHSLRRQLEEMKPEDIGLSPLREGGSP